MTVEAAAEGTRELAGIAAAARAAIDARADEIDLLNVFPVADGDTGGNMAATVAAVERALGEGAGAPAAERAARVARAALMGARGNSGMILSQMVRGAAEVLGAGSGPVDGAVAAAALRAASDRADAAVRHPVEGTMLTVVRRAAEAAESAAGPLAPTLEAAAAAAAEAVERTTAQLDVLTRAGVVDAGGVGVAVLLDAVAAAVAGRAPAAAPARARPEAAAHPPSRHRWCTTFLVEGEGLDPRAVEAALSGHGDSLLVMGDPRQLKVHIHTDAPEGAVAAVGAWGAVTGLHAEDMRRQEAERARRLAATAPPAGPAPAVVADGEGVRALAEGLGARARAPGDPLDALLVDAGVVVVADRTGAPAARAAAAAAGRPAVAVDSPAALLACLVAFEPGDDAEANEARMRAAAAAVEVADIDGTDPARLRDELVRRLEELLVGGPQLVTLLLGAGAPVSPVEAEGWVRAAAARRGWDLEVEAHAGGQAAPAIAVGVE